MLTSVDSVAVADVPYLQEYHSDVSDIDEDFEMGSDEEVDVFVSDDDEEEPDDEEAIFDDEIF